MTRPKLTTLLAVIPGAVLLAALVHVFLWVAFALEAVLAPIGG